MKNILSTHVSQIESDLQVARECLREFRIHVQRLQKIVAVDFVQVAVRQRSHVTLGLTDSFVKARMLAEHVVFAQNGHHNVIFQDFDASARNEVQGG